MKKTDETYLPEAFQQDPWHQLKSFTRARIAIGRVGSSLPTKEVLDFGLSHAMARDAVHLALDVDALEVDIKRHDFITTRVKSMAGDRASYLLRPDMGRRLHEQSLLQLQNLHQTKPIDFLMVVGDGLYIGGGGGVGVAVQKGDRLLRKRFNDAIKASIQGGDYKTMAAKYFDFDLIDKR